MSARPHPSCSLSVLRGHLHLAAVFITEHNDLAASMPMPAQSTPQGVHSSSLEKAKLGVWSRGT